MPRPRKWRKVCCLPESNRFGPLNAPVQPDRVIMTVEEYETIRLIDLEGLTQEECAQQMNIARTTVQGIYAEARKKLAEFIVNGKVLWIEGGNYKLCEGGLPSCRGRGCRREVPGEDLCRWQPNRMRKLKEAFDEDSTSS